MWLLPLFCPIQVCPSVISFSSVYLSFSLFPFLSLSPVLLLVFPPSLGSSLLNSLPIALLALCPIRALSRTRGCVLRECQLHLAESKLEASSNGGPEWRVGRLWAEIPESFWGRRWRSGSGGERPSYPSPAGAYSGRGAGEMELVQHHYCSLHRRGDWTQQPCCALQNRRGRWAWEPQIRPKRYRLLSWLFTG